jgi:hypothetical protein
MRWKSYGALKLRESLVAGSQGFAVSMKACKALRVFT